MKSSLLYLLVSLCIVINSPNAKAQERPQTPLPPFPYRSVDVTYQVKTDTAVHLAATLTLPEGKGPFPAVLIIGGSGQFPRDQTFYGHKTMMVLADFLTRKGFATLRFDDRGAGKSTAGSKKRKDLVHADFIADAGAGFDFLQQHPDIHPAKIGLIGHSAGAIQGLELASLRKAYFSVMLSGAVESYPHEIVAQQSRIMAKAAGRSVTAQQADSSFIARSIFHTINESSYDKRNSAIKSIADEELLKIPAPEREIVQKDFYTRVNILSSEQFHQAANEKQTDWLLKAECPVLIINGDKDLNIDAGYHGAKMAASLKRNHHSKSAIHILPGINHMLQKAETGLSEESKDISETINPKVLEIIGNWLLAL